MIINKDKLKEFEEFKKSYHNRNENYNKNKEFSNILQYLYNGLSSDEYENAKYYGLSSNSIDCIRKCIKDLYNENNELEKRVKFLERHLAKAEGKIDIKEFSKKNLVDQEETEDKITLIFKKGTKNVNKK